MGWLVFTPEVSIITGKIGCHTGLLAGLLQPSTGVSEKVSK